MKFAIYNNSVKVSGATAIEEQQIETFCKFWDKSSLIMGKKNRWHKVEPIVLYKKRTFPIGLLNTFKEMFQNVEITDHRVVPIATPFEKDYSFSFLEHQEEAATFLRENVRGLVHAPTGFGKTYVAAEAIWQTQTIPFLYVVGVTASLKQIKDKLQSFLDIEIGMRGAGHRDVAPIMVVTAPSAARMDLSIFKGVVFDEVHKIPANTYYKIADACVNAFWCFGITGTIKGRSDGLDKMILATISDKIYEVPYEAAKLPPAKTLILPVAVPFLEGEFIQTYGPSIVKNTDRNKLISHVAQKSFTGENVVFVFVGRKEHGRLLCELIPDAVYADKDTPISEREQILQSSCILVATSIFAESIDCVQMDTVVNAAAGKSEINIRQLVGRGLRRAEGKELRVYDFLDQDGGLYERHSKIRQRFYQMYGPVRFLL